MKASDHSAGGQPTDPNAPAHPAPLALARVPFRGGFILAAAGPVDQEGNRPVPLAPFCEALGIDAKSQRQKLRGKAWACEVIITSQIPGDDQARRVFCIPLRALPMWLATIHPAKVAPEARPMLEAFQSEACDVLYRHFLAPSTPAAAALQADMGAKLNEVRTKLAEVVWAMHLPTRESPDLDPASAEELARRKGGVLVTVRPELPAGEALEELRADVAHLGVLLGFEAGGALPDGVIIPTLDNRSRTILRVRAWLAECARPLTNEERQGRARERGITAQQAADSYNRWAWGRGFGPMNPQTMSRWLADSSVHGLRRVVCRKGHRYQIALLPSTGTGLVAVNLGQRCA